MSKALPLSRSGLVAPGTPMSAIVENLGQFALGDKAGCYLLEAKRPFEDLRQVVSLLAAILLATDTGIAGKGLRHPLLDQARDLFQECGDKVDSLSPAPQTEHHHRHLTRARQAAGAALDALERGVLGGDKSALDLVKLAWRELIHAANALPGFEAIDLSQSCCAEHARLRRPLLRPDHGESR
ncbi:MAG TPA: hypothetical protein VHA10_03820 [Hypericibacter adhaerens]|jgi:hypothetical protein|uniref:Uncharacterized protein n=1 Tax=Hypericibacter adhaerens TaxID=2602016 RepID=A0A5J6N001_9PROT|nr:hypothetical protein [Hypericibacter adhaerens]QEX22757.1 hypothetical protein FRZ61_26890 [Hypericibacter adhaerens]HWA42313.1 hypothetical protein [Hypericibacter adhaerens]